VKVGSENTGSVNLQKDYCVKVFVALFFPYSRLNFSDLLWFKVDVSTHRNSVRLTRIKYPKLKLLAGNTHDWILY